MFESNGVRWSQNVSNGRSMREQVTATIKSATVFYWSTECVLLECRSEQSAALQFVAEASMLLIDTFNDRQ